ncbi:MAG TPA: ATP-binding protein [bacterium]|nr:ATP-binding protein [bacterium]
MFQRLIEHFLLSAVQSFSSVILTGARQTGKTTLCRTLLGKTHRYVSLEDPDVRRIAIEDPRAFLETNSPPVILDEIQYAPELPSYLQGLIDKDRQRYGRFILTGSQNFLLMEKVSQSLAGRAALLTLYPASVEEIDGASAAPRSSSESVADWVLRGGYPELRDRPELDRKTWCASYIRLYVERDVRRLSNVGDLDSFERFLHLAAGRTGCLLNASELGRDAGVTQPTAQRWISLLQASYQIHLLRPFHANLSKRLIKSPKLYFGDTALASYLMGLHDASSLLQGPFLGPLFETAVFLEHLKYFGSRGDLPPMSFFRTSDGIEVDLLIEDGGKLHAREIKSAKTPSPLWGGNLLALEKLLKKPLVKTVLAPVDSDIALPGGVTARPWHRVGI